MNLMTQPLVAERPPIQRAQTMKFGSEITATGVRFRIWAPNCPVMALRIEEGRGDLPMSALPRGWFELEVPGAGPGTRYSFVLPDGMAVPDPASRFQPEDVHGPSEVIDPRAYAWRDNGWRGRAWEESVIYELHIGTFTEAGTYSAAMGKLDYLVELGVTAIQIMPLADFEGRWNWGYDGVLHFAPDSSYGRPEDLKAFIDAAHARSLQVFLDVVYNHFGPSGNYMPLYAPLTTEKHSTPWGAGINYDDEGSVVIRDFVLTNAQYWLNEFHFDGLRFDAVHAIQDASARHLLEDMAELLRGATSGRFVHLVLENSDNGARWLSRREDLTPRLYTAQWNDDVHHVLHTAITGENHWYYSDFAGRTDLLGRALAEGYAYQGEMVPREGRPRGEPSAHLPSTAFVGLIQNHDQVGNRPLGERLHMLAPAPAVRAAAAINLLCPHIPMLFMGEEWATDKPFCYFSDIQDLAQPIRESRLKELADSPGVHRPDELPDPMSESTFHLSKLDWAEHQGPKAEWLELYRKLLQLRREQIVPRLEGIDGNAGEYELLPHGAVRVGWHLGDGSRLTLLANLTPGPVSGVELPAGERLWLEGTAEAESLGAWTVLFTLVEGSRNK